MPARHRRPHAAPLLEPLEPRVLLTVATAVAVTAAGSKLAITVTAADPAAPPNGTVTLTEGATVIATVQVSQPFIYEGVPNQPHNIAQGYYTLLLKAGVHHITATYNPTADFAASAASLDVPIAPLNLVIYPTMPGRPATVIAIDTHDHRYFHLDVMAGFAGGIQAAAGDVNGDGFVDLVVAAGKGGGPAIQVFDLFTGHLLQQYFAYDPAFRGGISLAVADVDGDGADDIITGTLTGVPEVREFSGRTGAKIADFLAYPADFTGGIRVAAGDVDGDGQADVAVATGPGAPGQVILFKNHTHNQLWYTAVGPASYKGGIQLALGDIDHDGKAELVTTFENGPLPVLNIFKANVGFVQTLRAYASPTATYLPISPAIMDVDGDGYADFLLSSREALHFINGRTHATLISGFVATFAHNSLMATGYNQPAPQ
jgi:hypothetical protein